MAKDRSSLVRAAVAEGLRNRGRDDDTVHLLRQLWQDSAATTRAAAIRSLGPLGDQAEVREAALDKEPAVRAAAAAALEPSSHSVPMLLSLLHDSDLEVVRASIRVLGQCPGAGSGPIWERLRAVAPNRALCAAAGAAVAAVFERDLSCFADALFSWPDSGSPSHLMWEVAKRARSAEVTVSAWAAARFCDEREDLRCAWDDVTIAFTILGREDLAAASAWLGECVDVCTLEEIAHMHATAPAFSAESVVLLSRASRAAARAARASSSAAREGFLSQALADIETVLLLRPGRASWRRVRQIAHRWRLAIEDAIAGSTGAKLSALLCSRRVVAGGEAHVLVKISNDGKDAASGVRACVNGLKLEVADVCAGAETYAVVPLREGASGTLAIRGSVSFHDAKGPHEVEFNGQVKVVKPGKMRPAPNPYVVGKPLDPDSHMFFGRTQTMEAMERALASGDHGSVVVLVGHRRTGKTSLLRQLEKRLAGEYRPIFVDVQGMMPRSTLEFFGELADVILAGAGQAALWRAGATADGSGADMVREAAARYGRPVVLLIDEFDDLEEKVRTGRLSGEVFGQLRHLIQHADDLRFVLSGTHRLEQLAGEYWSFLLNLATYQSLGCMSRTTAEQVIREPMDRLGIVCEDAAVTRAVSLTGSHPYFLQLLGFRLVEGCVASGEGAVRSDLVDKAADEVTDHGEIHLRYLWESAGSQGQIVLRTLAQAEGGLRRGELESRSGLDKSDVTRALQRLSALELLAERNGRHLLRIGLVGRWISRQLTAPRAG
jgi:hypothetical protein